MKNRGTRLFSLTDSARSIGSGGFGQAVSIWAVSVTEHFGLDVSVWVHFGRRISVHKQLIIIVYLNYYIGRRNVTLAGVIRTLFDVAAT